MEQWSVFLLLRSNTSPRFYPEASIEGWGMLGESKQAKADWGTAGLKKPLVLPCLKQALQEHAQLLGAGRPALHLALGRDGDWPTPRTSVDVPSLNGTRSMGSF